MAETTRQKCERLRQEADALARAIQEAADGGTDHDLERLQDMVKEVKRLDRLATEEEAGAMAQTLQTVSGKPISEMNSTQLRQTALREIQAAAAMQPGLSSASAAIFLAHVRQHDSLMALAAQKDGESGAFALMPAVNAAMQTGDLTAVKSLNLLSQKGKGTMQVVQSPSAGVLGENFEGDPKRGFKSGLEFLSAIRAAQNGGGMDARLRSLAAGSDEQGNYSDPFGGFLVPEGFLPDVKMGAWEGDPTAALVSQVPMAQSTMKVPYRVDKDHTSSVSGGLAVYRRNETAAVNASRMEVGLLTLAADSLMGVSYVTEELLEDSAVNFAALLERGYRTQFASRILDEKIGGSGTGQYLGVLNSPCLITVAKEGSQAADTINSTNVIKMRGRCWGYSGAIWLANQDAYGQLCGMHLSGTNSDQFIFAPGNGADVPDTLLGRPIHFVEECATLGDLGDIILGNWAEYLEGVYKPVEGASSIHVRFVNNERTFRFIMRCAGSPWWDSALTPKNSAVTLSPFVTLAERAAG